MAEAVLLEALQAQGPQPLATSLGFSWKTRAVKEFEPGNPKHREVATQWLARRHTASSVLTEELPQCWTDHYFEHLSAARRTIRQNYSNPGLSPADREVLDQILHRLDLVGSRWVEVESICRTMPRSVVHVHFAERNVRVRRKGADLGLFVFDWEVAGWVLVPVALAHDITLYWSLVHDIWCSMDLETLQRQITLCKLLRGGVAATNWIAGNLATAHVDKPIRHLIVYCARMTESLRAPRWIA